MQGEKKDRTDPMHNKKIDNEGGITKGSEQRRESPRLEGA